MVFIILEDENFSIQPKKGLLFTNIEIAKSQDLNLLRKMKLFS